MQKFTQESNGRILEIHIDENALYAKLDEDVKKMEDLKTEVADAGGEEAYEDYKYEYHQYEYS